MKKMMKAFACGFALVVSLGLGMIVEAGRIPSHMVPLQTYATKKLTCYVSPGGAAKGWIDPGDYVIVNQIRNDGWAYGSYPVKNGRTSRWFRVDDLLNNPSFRTLDRMSPSYKVNVYKNYSYNGTIGSIWGNENIWVVSNLGDVWQIVYKVNNGGYKMGWVPYWDCLEKQPSFNGVKGDMNQDGKVDKADAQILTNIIVGKTARNSIYKQAGDMNNDGELDIIDVSNIVMLINGKKDVQYWESLVGKKLPTINLNSECYVPQKPGKNPFKKSYTGHPTNCTWYAIGRFKEVNGRWLGVTSSPGGWIQQARSKGFATGYEPRSKSVGVRGNNSGKTPHVLFVEFVANGYAYITEVNVGNPPNTTKYDYIVRKYSFNDLKNIKKVTEFIYP